MKSIIEELYEKCYSPVEKLLETSPEYRELLNELDENEAKLFKFFEKNEFHEQNAVFNKVIDSQTASAVIIAKERFIAGFKMGAGAAKEILNVSAE